MAVISDRAIIDESRYNPTTKLSWAFERALRKDDWTERHTIMTDVLGESALRELDARREMQLVEMAQKNRSTIKRYERRLDRSKLKDVLDVLPDDATRDAFVKRATQRTLDPADAEARQKRSQRFKRWRHSKSARNDDTDAAPSTEERDVRKRKRTEPYRLRSFPKQLVRCVRESGVLDIELPADNGDGSQESEKLFKERVEARIEVVLGYFQQDKLALNTVRTYMTTLKAHGLFGARYRDPNVFLPSRLDLGVWSTQRVHERIVDERHYTKFYNHVASKRDKFHAPLLVALTAVLRSFEIVQITNESLRDLVARRPVVKDVVLKSTSLFRASPRWKPVYTREFVSCVELLAELYADALVSPLRIHLFPISISTLDRHFTTVFSRINNIRTSLGFGVHICRYTTAQRMNNMNVPLEHIRRLLGHSKASVTEKYIRRDFTAAETRLNAMFEREFVESQTG